MSKKFYVILTTIALTMSLLMTFTLAGCGSNQSTYPEGPKVRTITIGSELSNNSNGYAGTIHNGTETSLSFQVGGRVVQKNISIGDQVVAGQILGSLNSSDTANQVTTANAGVSSAQSTYELAKTNAERYRQLYAQDAVSKIQLDQMEQSLQVATAQLEQAQANLNISKNQYGYTILVAPSSGIITSTNFEPGQMVSAGQTVGTLAVGRELEAVIALPEQEMEHVYIGMPARITFWALPNTRVDGVIKEISPVPDSVARTYTVKVSLTNPPDTVQLGMTVNCVLLSQKDSIITVPLTSLIKGENNTSQVFVVRDNKAVLVTIKTSQFSDNSVIVTDGLSKGDVVITAGTQQIKDGETVRL